MTRPRVRHIYMWLAIHRLNCLYHVYPSTANDVWRANVRQLLKRMHVFNGRLVVAVAVDDTTHTAQEVQREFGDVRRIEMLVLPNDPTLRETATLLPLLEAVQSENKAEATFYAHTKGNSTRDSALGAELWRNAMYHHLLDHVHVCRDLLMSHPCVGTHKMVYPRHSPDLRVPYPTRLQHGNWLFAGTFFWFRHDAVFTHPAWRDVPRDRYGAEAWLSGLFHHQQAASVFQPWPADQYPTPSPYNPRIYRRPIRDE